MKAYQVSASNTWAWKAGRKKMPKIKKKKKKIEMNPVSRINLNLKYLLEPEK